MATIKMIITDNNWNQGNIGTVVTAMTTVLDNHSLVLENTNIPSVDGIFKIDVDLRRDDMTYSQYKDFVTEIEGILPGSTTLLELSWKNDV